MSNAAHDNDFTEICEDGGRRHIKPQLILHKTTERSFYKRTKALNFTVKFIRQGKPVSSHVVSFRSTKKWCLLDVTMQAVESLHLAPCVIRLKGYLPHEKPRPTLIVEI